MSVIHEALKRAEQERSAGLIPQTLPPALAGGSPASCAATDRQISTRPRRFQPRTFAALAAALLLLAGGYWARHREKTATATPASPVTATPAPVPRTPGVSTDPRAAQSDAPVPLAVPAAAAAPAAGPTGDADPARLNARAVTAFQAGRLEEARGLLEQILRLAPAMPEAHNNHGMVLRAQGRRAEAKEEFLRALALLPGYPEALNNLGLVWVEEGKQDEAIRSFEKALGAKPGYRSAHLNLAVVYDKLGKRTDAVSHYRRFLAGAGTDEQELVRRVNERLRR